MADEPDIPFELGTLYEDERIIVVDKPHFLATTPRGMWYRSTALMRLRQRLGEPQITPAHRLDRATAGVLVFVRDPAARGPYQMLFQEHKVDKVYECLAPARPVHAPALGSMTRMNPPAAFPLLRRSHIDKHPGHMQALEVRAEPNATTLIDLDRQAPARLLGPRNRGSGPLYRVYRLRPRTGKTHQLRVHMNALGLPILGDDLYPQVIDRPYDDFIHPLQLVARRLSFVDPFSRQRVTFTSRILLDFGR
ncbi:pseudouridine synthase [Bifidobacterium xylocopae]|uniref:RNA pseudouridylate synthase n=1 Tax=Bifidobacterium xylocopae TaxID=2493119 RepID=A0A366KFA9_9BIFI|nr:pseudouridine synthase [Bifidobacterium xylocopae]RBP99898.1 23S rRNA pseudouridylate synthase [Bifidobacterium xylocopae]